MIITSPPPQRHALVLKVRGSVIGAIHAKISKHGWTCSARSRCEIAAAALELRSPRLLLYPPSHSAGSRPRTISGGGTSGAQDLREEREGPIKIPPFLRFFVDAPKRNRPRKSFRSSVEFRAEFISTERTPLQKERDLQKTITLPSWKHQ